jgi:hypothetical protein
MLCAPSAARAKNLHADTAALRAQIDIHAPVQSASKPSVSPPGPPWPAGPRLRRRSGRLKKLFFQTLLVSPPPPANLFPCAARPWKVRRVGGNGRAVDVPRFCSPDWPRSSCLRPFVSMTPSPAGLHHGPVVACCMHAGVRDTSFQLPSQPASKNSTCDGAACTAFSAFSCLRCCMAASLS